MSIRNLMKLNNKKYNNENILYIPNIDNIDNINSYYNINNIYTPRKFTDTNEYITHLENLRKLKNYPNISKHLDLLNNSPYKNIVKNKLLKLNWYNKIKEQSIQEKESLVTKLNDIKRAKSSLKKENKVEKIHKRCKSSLNYKNLKKINIKNSDINNLRKELKLDKFKLPKI